MRRSTYQLGLAIGFCSLITVPLVIEMPAQQPAKPKKSARPKDAVEDAQTPREVKAKRPEQKKSKHDESAVFAAPEAEPITKALNDQPQQGDGKGFDLYRDPLNSDRPMKPFSEIMQADIDEKAQVMQDQQKLLERRYNLEPKLDPEVTMHRGKPLCVGPTARLSDGTTWEKLAG